MKKGEKGVKIVLLIIILILSMYIVNAGIFDSFTNIWDSITGYGASDTTTANVSIASIAPVIFAVTAPPTQTITEKSYINVSFQFNATDADGAGDLNNATAKGYFNLTSQEAIRSNTSCAYLANTNSTSSQFNCTIAVWWYDTTGDWQINATIQDSSGSAAFDIAQTFTISPTRGMEMGPTGVSWSGVNLGDTNTLSGDDPITINNTGNVNLTNINITGYMLHGNTTASQFIYAANFSANIADACGGVNLTNATQQIVPSASATNDNYTVNDGRGQEQLYFCLVALEGIGGSLSIQTYATLGTQPWEVKVD